MEKKQHGKRTLIIVLIIGAIVLAIGVRLFFDLPIYPAFSKEVASVSKVQSKLSKCSDTKSVVVIDPSELGLETTTVNLLLQGRTRSSDPRGYVLVCRDSNAKEKSVRFTFSAEAQKEPFDGELYRGVPTFLRTHTTFVRSLDFDLYVDGVMYQLGASYPFDGMTQAELDAEDEELTELFLRAADILIDAGLNKTGGTT